MKILYSVQATGNGHISRAHQLLSYLQNYGNVDVCLSGTNSNLDINIPIKYKCKGLSLFYNTCGGLDYRKMFSDLNLKRIYAEARQLPVEKYDLIINDFDHITSKACKIKKITSIQFGHQASFMSDNTPRPLKKNWIGEKILKNYAPSTHYVGLHFDQYDSFIFPPIIKNEFIHANPFDHGHITVYLPSYETKCLKEIFKEVAPTSIHWFQKDVTKPYVDGNITFFPIDQRYFNQSLLYCHGLLTGGGFETPAEALFLGKKLLAIPIKGQYEQQCNAAALEKMGVSTLKYLSEKNKIEFFNWIFSTPNQIRQKANDITETLEFVINLAHTKRVNSTIGF